MIALGSDHGGLALKRHVMEYLDARGLEYQDFGCYTAESCDYPDFGRAAAEAVASGACDRGIVICTTGIGISIAANKVKGIRCALCSEPLSAEMTRRHNDANMLAMGGGLIASWTPSSTPRLRAAATSGGWTKSKAERRTAPRTQMVPGAALVLAQSVWNTASAAARVASSSAWVWASEMNMASNWAGARATPRSSIPWK